MNSIPYKVQTPATPLFANIKLCYENIQVRMGCETFSKTSMNSFGCDVDNTYETVHNDTCKGRNALLGAVAKGKVGLVRSLFKMSRSNINANGKKNSSISFSCGSGSAITDKYSAYVPNNKVVPLHFSALNGYTEITKLLVEEGSNVNAKDDEGITPLHLASGKGHKEIVEFLLKNGADSDAKSINGITPLHLAASEGCLSVVQLLILNGAFFNAKTHDFTFRELRVSGGIIHSICYWTPLHFAINNYNFSVVKTLLQIAVSAESDYVDSLNLAGRDFFLKALEFLMSIDKHVKEIGLRNYLWLFKIGIQKGCSEVIPIFIKNGIDVNAKDEFGETPLHYATMSGYLDIVKVLLKKGVDVNIVDSEGYSPLHYMVIGSSRETYIVNGKSISFLNPVIEDRKYANNVVALFLDSGCSRDSILNCIRLLNGRTPVDFRSLEPLIRYHLLNEPEEKKPRHLLIEEDWYIANDLSEYWDKCLLEIEEMKEHFFNDKLSLYSFCIERNLNKMASYVQNEEIVNYCQSNACQKDYHVYGDLILKKVLQGKRRRNLLSKLDNLKIYCVSSSVVKEYISLNIECQLNVAKYLNDDDLINLLKSAIFESSSQFKDE